MWLGRAAGRGETRFIGSTPGGRGTAELYAGQDADSAIYDELTRLYNFRYFQDRVVSEARRATRYDQPLTLLMIDADDYKAFNDSKGHLAGNMALRRLATVLKKTVREVDVAARYGREEFAILLPSTGKLAALKPDFTSVVGSALGVPCRLFDKGNPLAVKELRNLAQTLAGSEAAEESRRAFARRVIETSVPALESSFGREELIPLGPEAAFAAAFAERFGASTSQALKNFVSEVTRLMESAGEVAGPSGRAPPPRNWAPAIPSSRAP